MSTDLKSNFPVKRALGTCYYPEHWPQEKWAEDAALMVKTGLTFVRIAEFSWSRLEPLPGEMDWEWLDNAIEVLGTAGLKIILCTPTATPPRWVLEKWSDMLALDEGGTPRKFGSRRHYCFSHQGYRGECARITQLIGERYGKHPFVHAWQTDNEYGCHDTTRSYSASALQGFRDWLAQKYQSPQALNKAWGNVFWSMEYTEFEQIDLPNLTVTEPNPSHVMDFKHYSSDMVVQFNRVQTDILRKLTDRPLVHNFMGRTTSFDHYKVGADLDVASWDSYPLGFLEVASDQDDAGKQKYCHQGDPDFQAFHHDLYRTVGKGRMWVMEQQPGPVNWAPYNPAPLPGMARLWAWEAFAHGAETVCYFRWRQVPFAQEQMHAGLLRPDSNPAPALAEAATVAKELAQMREAGTTDAPVALVFDYQSHWAWETQPQGRSFDYFRLVFDFYRALRRLGISIDIIAPDAIDISPYKIVLAPGLMRFSSNLQEAITHFEGLMIAGPRAGSKTPDMRVPENLPPEIDGLECTVEYVQSLRPDVKIPLACGGAFVHWAEKLSGSAPILETTTQGDAALVGSNRLWYLAGWPNAEALGHILKRACMTQKVQALNLPEELRVRDCGDYRFFFNYGPKPVEFDGKIFPVAGVHWCHKK